MSRRVFISSHLLANVPKLFYFLGYFVGARNHFFIGFTPVVDHLSLVEPIVQDRADGTLGERLTFGRVEALGI